MRKKSAAAGASETPKSTGKRKPPHVLLKEKYQHLIGKKNEPAIVKQAAQQESKQNETKRSVEEEELQDVEVSDLEKPFHLLLKVRSESGQTINDHEAMIAAKGTALLGKMGQGVGTSFTKVLNAQIERGIPTYLFLTIREGWNGEYVTYRCRLRQVSDKIEESKLNLVPAYYRSSASHIKAWFEISSMTRLSREEMNRIYVLSSNREIMSVISSSATIYHVGVRKPRP